MNPKLSFYHGNAPKPEYYFSITTNESFRSGCLVCKYCVEGPAGHRVRLCPRRQKTSKDVKKILFFFILMESIDGMETFDERALQPSPYPSPFYPPPFLFSFLPLLYSYIIGAYNILTVNGCWSSSSF